MPASYRHYPETITDSSRSCRTYPEQYRSYYNTIDLQLSIDSQNSPTRKKIHGLVKTPKAKLRVYRALKASVYRVLKMD